MAIPLANLGLPVPGYSIHFPRFDLGHSFEATYHFADLPNSQPTRIYLCVNNPAADGGYIDRELTTANFRFDSKTIVESSSRRSSTIVENDPHERRGAKLLVFL